MKICGIERAESVDIAIEYGADFIGFVFYSPSPRNLTPEKAKQLKSRIPKHVTTVGLFVDPTNSEIDDVLAAIDLRDPASPTNRGELILEIRIQEK